MCAFAIGYIWVDLVRVNLVDSFLLNSGVSLIVLMNVRIDFQLLRKIKLRNNLIKIFI